MTIFLFFEFGILEILDSGVIWETEVPVLHMNSAVFVK